MNFKDLLLLSESGKLTEEQIKAYAESEEGVTWDDKTKTLIFEDEETYISENLLEGFDLGYMLVGSLNDIKFNFKNGKLSLDMDDFIQNLEYIYSVRSVDMWKDVYRRIIPQNEKKFLKQLSKDISKIRKK